MISTKLNNKVESLLGIAFYKIHISHVLKTDNFLKKIFKDIFSKMIKKFSE